MAKTQTIQGAIEQTNDRGLCIGGQWLNWSKFGEGPDPFLSAGMEVAVTATETGWIKSVETLAAGELAVLRRPAKQLPQRQEQPAFVLGESPQTKVTQSELIVRQSMMKASCMFWHGQQVTTQIICDFADELVKHVLRGV